MSEPEERFIPREIADRNHAELLEAMIAGTRALAVELTPLARRDTAAFERAWCEGIERLEADVAEGMLEKIRNWAAPERQWKTSQRTPLPRSMRTSR